MNHISEKLLWLLALCLAMYVNTALAVLEITVLKQGEDPLPIVFAPLKTIGSVNTDVEYGKEIASIMHDNFNRTGKFKVFSIDNAIDDDIYLDKWKDLKIEALVFGKIEQVNKKVFNIWIHLIDVYSAKELYFKKIVVHNSGIRRIAHYLSDQIYYALLGEKGSFDTRLVYVVVDKQNKNLKYRLEIADSDTKNPQVVVQSAKPILSPAWSPDQSKIAYVSFRNGRSEIFIQYPFVRRKTQKILRFDGIASSPSWHPNGEGIVMTLSKNGNKDIYSYNLKSKKLTRLTHDIGIDTEASYSPDGESIVFTSNRSGKVQIYIKNLLTNKIRRVIFDGDYNAKAVFSPDGENLALVHKVGRDYRIALLNIKSNDLTVMTENQEDESPYFSPNGNMIIFSTKKNNKSILSVVSILGRQIFELDSKDGEVREPNWSYYSK